MTEIIKVYKIVAGPFHSFDVDDPDYEGDFYFCQCIVETPDGGVSEEEIRFETFPEIYEIQAHLSKYVKPYEMEAEAF